MENAISTPTVENITCTDQYTAVPSRNCWILLSINYGHGKFRLHASIDDFDTYDCFLITSYEKMTFVAAQDTVCEFTVITFHHKSLVNTGINIAPLQMLDDFLNSFKSYSRVPFRKDQFEIFHHYTVLCLTLQKEHQPYSMQIFHHTFFALLLYAARTYFTAYPDRRQGKVSSQRVNMVQNTKQIILERYSENISLTSIAEAVFTSPSYLSRAFKEETGMSLSYYLNEVRIENVKRLLVDTDNLIVDIAVGCGYNYIPYFNQTFKKYTGLSPGVYRKKYKQPNT